MELIIGLVAFFVGLFTWAQVIYPLFLVLPKANRLKRKGALANPPYVKILVAPIISIIVMASGVILGKQAFAIGLVPALLLILLKIGDPKNQLDILESYPEIVKAEVKRS